MQDESARFLGKKAYEIAYALCRVASRACPAAKEKLEESAFRVVSGAVALRIHELGEAIAVAKMEVKLAADTGLIHKANGELLLGEIAKSESFIKSAKELDSGRMVEIEAVFSPYHIPVPEKKRERSTGGTGESADRRKEDVDARSEGLSDGDRQASEIRQTAILEFVKKTGNCRMRDLVEQFPETSERTVRYDLQALLGKGLLERTGEGGPGTYYREKADILPDSRGEGTHDSISHGIGGSNL